MLSSGELRLLQGERTIFREKIWNNFEQSRSLLNQSDEDDELKRCQADLDLFLGMLVNDWGKVEKGS